MKILPPPVLILLGLLGLLLVSCTTAKVSRSPAIDLARRSSSDARTTALAPGCYNRAYPHRKLYVEIDYVEGARPSAGEIEVLRSFLKRFCDKPDGIEIKIDSSIPRAVAASRTLESLEAEYIGGERADHAAVLYILFTDSSFSGDKREPFQPYYQSEPYPAIFMDRAYAQYFFPAKIRAALLLHEAGHALGLVENPMHAEARHCNQKGCRMRPEIRFTFHYSWLLTLRNPWEDVNVELCALCTADLLRARATPDAGKNRFWQGYYLQARAGYQILSLPHFTYVHFGDEQTLAFDEVHAWRVQALKNIAAESFVCGHLEPGAHCAALADLVEQRSEVAEVFLRNLGVMMKDYSAPPQAHARVLEAYIAMTAKWPDLQQQFRDLRAKIPHS